MKSKAGKILALSSFITLISIFLLYSGGYFNESKENVIEHREPVSVSAPPENSVASLNSIDTVIDTLAKERMWSSKSIIIPPTKWIPREKRAIHRDSISMELIRMMSSSKSGPIFHTSTFDSLLKTDSQKIEKKKDQ